MSSWSCLPTSPLGDIFALGDRAMAKEVGLGKIFREQCWKMLCLRGVGSGPVFFVSHRFLSKVLEISHPTVVRVAECKVVASTII